MAWVSQNPGFVTGSRACRQVMELARADREKGFFQKPLWRETALEHFWEIVFLLFSASASRCAGSVPAACPGAPVLSELPPREGPALPWGRGSRGTAEGVRRPGVYADRVLAGEDPGRVKRFRQPELC